jgi:hypothetical protein
VTLTNDDPDWIFYWICETFHYDVLDKQDTVWFWSLGRDKDVFAPDGWTEYSFGPWNF